jgi:hypothetical protein
MYTDSSCGGADTLAKELRVDGLSSVRMDVAAIGATQYVSQQSGPARGHPAMDAAAKALGMNASELRTALQSGQSLATIAKSKGVSQDTLTAAMATAIEQANPSISADQANRVATAIATRTPPAGGQPPFGPAPDQGASSADPTAAIGTPATSRHHHHHHHAMSAAMDTAAKTLGTTTSDLMTQLQSGQSLASIATSKGISQTDLVKAISTALQSAGPNLSSDQATNLATSLVTGTQQSNQQQAWSTGNAGPSSTYSVLA